MIPVLFSVLSSVFGVLFVCRNAQTLRLVDIPEQRSSHVEPTPKGGGLGIVLAFCLMPLWSELPILVWLSALGIAITGFFADCCDFSPRRRLVVFFLCAGMFSLSQGNLATPVAVLLVPASLIFIVGTANFYNFMDGINGMAAITGIVSFALLGFYGVFVDKSAALVMVCFVLSAACLGFLPFNVPQARIFMGDVGSVFLGFLFSGICVVFSENAFEFTVLASFLLLFYLDELLTMAQRIHAGMSLLQPHRMHLYQVLANEASFPQWTVSLAYGLIQLFCGLTGIWCYLHDRSTSWAVFLVFVGVVFIGVDLLVKNKFSVKLSV
ncbi:hypothetical protein [uncultured Desulfuromonas sp.]|uniref:glycosyltransferase family 4 protein n=1 Tax=uncultured Desulfuromonas sp. TaxID=181013 RepID=UPI002AABAF9E|nr:hypothetical protein [uncultured Desulfuromonas sp.]